MSRTSSFTFGALTGSPWTCPNCAFVNRARENECGSCPTPKPDPYSFRTASNHPRTTRASHSSSTSAAPVAPRRLRSSAAAVDSSSAPQSISCRTAKRKTRSAIARPLAVAVEEEAAREADEPTHRGEGASDSDDESLQQRHADRPKRHCAERTQQRVNSYFKATKANTPATPKPPSSQATQKQQRASADVCPTIECKSAVESVKPAQIVCEAPALVMRVPTAFAPPVLAPTPFVPATRDEAIALLNRVHATLALSAFPTAASALLPSRHLHLSHLCSFLARHLAARTPAALYVAGRPGVGKTLTVDWALQSTFGPASAVLGSNDGAAGGGGGGQVWRYGGGRAKGKAASGAGLPATTVVTVNAIAMMKGHGSFWCKLLAMLVHKGRPSDELLSLSADEALRRLQLHLDRTRSRGEMIVLVMDEIDALASSAATSPSSAGSAGGGGGGGGSFSLLHALFRLVYGASSCVVLLSISNNITLLDAHCAALAAAHALPERVVFSTYAQTDLLHILHERLLRCLPAASAASASAPSTAAVALPFFAPAALDFICKATSKDTGDIRRCLRDCRHAVQQLLTGYAAAPPSAPFDPAGCQLTVSSLARVKAEREAATQHGRLSELSAQQLHVLWALALSGGVAVGKAGEWYRRCVARVRCGLTELSGGEVSAVLEMLESEGMVRKDKQGKAVRYVSVVGVERMRRQLRGDLWDALWPRAQLIQST